MLIFCSIVLIRIIATESRVPCGVINSSPWVPLGYSCPVNCQNVIYTIERLKMLDYQSLLAGDAEIRNDLSSSKQVMDSIEAQIHLTYNSTKNGRRSHLKEGEVQAMYKEFATILKRKTTITILQKRLSKTSSHCSILLKKKKLIKKYLDYCSRRLNVEEDFLRVLTDVINKHTKVYKFTPEMTKILLQKILGSNADLRNGIFDIKKILIFLQSASPRGPSAWARLGSRHCLRLYVPGCFCRRGYVENSGACVSPSNCSIEESLKKYLSRISVN